jgi:ATP-dependent DNA helicase RecG
VGIDVPEASFLVVHDAEQFGLAQLHQLRGRVGRGGQQAHCYLFVQPEASDDSVERLRVLEDTLDGFDVARADLRQRGIGDLTGTRQSGAAWFELGDVWDDRDIMKQARSEAERVVEESDGLQAPEYTLTRRKLDHDYREERRYVKVG